MTTYKSRRLSHTPNNDESFLNSNNEFTNELGNDFLPTVGETYDLGADGQDWDNAYIKNIILTGATPNRMVRTGDDNTLTAENHFVDATRVGINVVADEDTNAQAPIADQYAGPAENLHVEGSTRLHGEVMEGYADTSVLAGTWGHAEGRNTLAAGLYSHAEGYGGETSMTNFSIVDLDDSDTPVVYTSNVVMTGYETYLITINNSIYQIDTILQDANEQDMCFTTTADIPIIIDDLPIAAQILTVGSMAVGIASHIEGGQTIASGNYSHAEGYQTTASGNYSHAEGNNNVASGSCSHAEGYYTTANHLAQHVFGIFNEADPSTNGASGKGNYIEIVGNGTSDANRSNARILNWDGDESIAKDFIPMVNGTQNIGSLNYKNVDPADPRKWKAIFLNGDAGNSNCINYDVTIGSADSYLGHIGLNTGSGTLGIQGTGAISINPQGTLDTTYNTITGNGYVFTSTVLYPSVNNTISLGDSSHYWANAYLNNIYFSNDGTNGEANRLVWTDSNKMFKATNHYADASHVAINSTSAPSYALYIEGDTHASGWHRATNGFYCEGSGVHYTHNSTRAEMDIVNNNEMCIGTGNGQLHINHTTAIRGTTVNHYLWKAGTSSTYAQHNMGNVVPGVTDTYTLGGGTLIWQKGFLGKLNLMTGSKAGTFGRISWYADNYYTWYDYMANATNGWCPTGGRPSTPENVTAWARRSIIENAANYGWVWESINNAAAGANTTQPNAIFSISSNNGRALLNTTPANDTYAFKIVSNTAAATIGTGYQHGIHYLVPNMGAGSHAAGIMFGKSANAGNVGCLQFNWDANNGAANSVGIGFWSRNNVLTVYNDQRVTVGNSTSTGSFGLSNTTNSTGNGISLYGGAVVGMPQYGIAFAGSATFGTFGGCTESWQTYFTTSNHANRGWIFKRYVGTDANTKKAYNSAAIRASDGVYFGGGVSLYHPNANAWCGDFYISAIGTANSGDDNATRGTQGTTLLRVGNNIAWPAAGTAGGANNSTGIVRIYAENTYFTDIRSQTGSANRVFYLPNYNATMYAVHAGNNNAIGSATQPVYVAANGRATACTSYTSATMGFLYLPRVTQDYNVLPGLNTVMMKEYSSTSANRPTSHWYHVMTGKGSDANYATQLALGMTLHRLYYRIYNAASWAAWKQVWIAGDAVTSAVWNDYAEYRETDTIDAGRCVSEVGDDSMTLSTKRLQKGCSITSDTWGFAQGQTEKAKTPIAVSGRVLAYPYEDREEFRKHIGDAVCSGPNGTVSIMTDEEVAKYPLSIIGTISAVPDYEEWGGGGNEPDRGPVKVNGRVWIRVR